MMVTPVTPVGRTNADLDLGGPVHPLAAMGRKLPVLPSVARRAIDLALEATVVPSFTRIGPAVRRRTEAWEGPSDQALAGEVVVVTGATSGLGVEIARGAARAGAEVVVVGRDRSRGEAMAEELAANGRPARFVPTDLSDLHAVRALAHDLLDRYERIHAMVHNAGALRSQRHETPQSLEWTWATMVVAPHLLTRALASRLDRAVWMSSGGMYLQAVDLDDLGWQHRPWDGTRAYAQAKRAQVDLVAEATARGEAPLQVAMHPGWATTPGVERQPARLRSCHGPVAPLPRRRRRHRRLAVHAPGLRARTRRLLPRPTRARGTVRWPGTATSPGDRRRLRSIVDEQTLFD
jgi:dehydrogenase/reductase SDR family member 12